MIFRLSAALSKRIFTARLTVMTFLFLNYARERVERGKERGCNDNFNEILLINEARESERVFMKMNASVMSCRLYEARIRGKSSRRKF